MKKATEKKLTRRPRSKKNIPMIKFRQSLFWDVDPRTVDPKKHADYIIERIMDFGNDKEVRWMMQYYSPRILRKVLRISRGVIHDKSKALWSLVYP